MTTPRQPRRKPQERAADLLRAELARLMARTAKLKEPYEAALAAEATVRQQIAALDQLPLPWMERPVIIIPTDAPTGGGGNGDDPTLPASWNKDGAFVTFTTTLTDVVVAEAIGAEGEVLPRIAPHKPRQRIGEKASISDVWNIKDGNSTVHTALMYARQDACEWCRKGIPFATEKRTEHYVVTQDDQGVERGFEYSPCKGIRSGE